MAIELAQDQTIVPELMLRNKEICEMFTFFALDKTTAEDFSSFTLNDKITGIKVTFDLEEFNITAKVYSNGFKSLKEHIDNMGIVPIVFDPIPAFEIKYPIRGNFEEANKQKLLLVLIEATKNADTCLPIKEQDTSVVIEVKYRNHVMYFIRDLASTPFGEQFEVAKKSIDDKINKYDSSKQVIVFYDSVVEAIDIELFNQFFNNKVYVPIVMK